MSFTENASGVSLKGRTIRYPGDRKLDRGGDFFSYASLGLVSPNYLLTFYIVQSISCLVSNESKFNYKHLYDLHFPNKCFYKR